MSAKARRRIAFQIIQGPNAGLSCPGWRVWTNKDTAYVAEVSTAGKWKVSLHGDVAWRLAQTAEDRCSAHPVLPAGHDRAPWRFAPTSFVDGRRHAFAIAVTRGAMLPDPVDQAETVVAVEDRWDWITTVYLEVTLPGVELTTSRRTLGDPLPLDGGRSLWLTAGVETAAGQPEQRRAVGRVIVPMRPETDDVSFPGLIVRGVHLG
ncbi:hypothetical protein [Cellulomonas hominis]